MDDAAIAFQLASGDSDHEQAAIIYRNSKGDYQFTMPGPFEGSLNTSEIYTGDLVVGDTTVAYVYTGCLDNISNNTNVPLYYMNDKVLRTRYKSYREFVGGDVADLDGVLDEGLGESISFDDAIKEALLLTFAFEGSSYTALTGNFDGQGISFGLLQWNIGQGTLQPLLQQMDSNHNQIMRSIFGTPYNSISTMLSLSKSDQLKWAASINDSNNALLPGWAQSFTALGNTAEFQAIQQSALNDYIIQAEKIYNDFGLTTERGVALAFDIAVQNWSVKAGTSIVNNSMTESQKLSAIANSVAMQSATAWQQDVLNRKMTIVNGTGTVHGKSYNLSSDYNIADRIIKK